MDESEKFNAMKTDIDVMKLVVEKHSEALYDAC